MGLSDRPKPNTSPTQSSRTEHDRGRHAEKPHEVPKQGWLDILVRTAKQFSADNLVIVAAGVAFFAFVAVVPSLAASIGIYGLVLDPNQVSQQITSFAEVLPQEVLPLLREQLTRITTNTQAASLSTVIGLLVALYGAAGATKALIQGLNIAYGEREKRGFVKLQAIALLLTIGVIIAALTAIALVAVIPALLQNTSFGSTLDNVINWARWPLLFVGFISGIAFLYRFGPSREDAKWSWVSWGATVAGLLWLAASGLFSLYVSKFGSYDKTYGSLGAVVVFLLWLWLSALSVLIGAELNAEMERQTLKDTTTGPQKPMGERGAQAADTVGPTRDKHPDKDKSRPPSGQRRGV